MPKKQRYSGTGFGKYFTFPEYDAEEERLKLECWLCLIWDGENPVEYLDL